MSPPASSEGMTRSEAYMGKRPKAVRVWLLGGFRVSVGSRTIAEDAWRLKKSANLIKLLALSPGHRLHREQVMDILWPDSGRKAASNNLRRVLHTARRVLNPDAGSRYLASHEESLLLCPEGNLWVDAEAFEEAVATVRRANEPAAYQAALDLYAGELLPGDRYEEWAENRREELRRLYLELLVELAGLYEERSEHERGVGVLRMVVEEEPSLEEAHVALMRLYALVGQEGEALAQYERLRGILSRELGAEPSTATRRLQEEIVAGRFLTARTVGPLPGEQPDPSKHNLPPARTTFVGREREMLEVKRELAMTRLLTLIGTGGSGKTRLALEVARDLVGTYADGVWLAELAPLSESGLLPQMVARALAVPERPGQVITDTLIDGIRAKSVLLVLDNCEHLVEDAAHLVDTLLDSCPRLRILATSREALGVEGEAIWRVPALSLPATVRLRASAEAARYEAVRLFAERARLRVSAFELTPDNAGAVAELCRKLDGIPLAIELAAARMGTLSVDQISERLRDPLGLLTSGGRTAAPRHQTLRGTLDWSYALLSEAEKELLGRLSVFAGGFALEAAEVVGARASVGEGDVLDVLSGLVGKSLVGADALSSEGILRYSTLEPVRQYAREKLDSSGEAEEVRARHARYYLAFAERAEPELTGPNQAGWMEWLDLEHDNLRAALAWALHGGDAEVGLRLAGALWRFWFTRGYLKEGQGWLEEALSGGIDTSPASSKVLNGAGAMAWLQGDPERAKGYFERSLAVSTELGDRAGMSRAMTNVAVAAVNLGDYARARELLEQCLELDREMGDERGVAYALGELGHMAYFQGDYEQATDYLEQTLALHRRLGDKRSIALTLENLGVIARHRREPQRAAELLEQSLATLHEIRDDWLTMIVFLQVGCLLTQESQAGRASLFLAATDRIRRERGFDLEPHAAEDYDHAVRRVRSELGEQAFYAAWNEGITMTLDEVVERPLLSGRNPQMEPTPEDRSNRQDSSLTRREEDIATLVARGLTNRQIASELSISEHTAATHIRRILKKLGLQSRSQVGSWLTHQRS